MCFNGQFSVLFREHSSVPVATAEAFATIAYEASRHDTKSSFSLISENVVTNVLIEINLWTLSVKHKTSFVNIFDGREIQVLLQK